MKHQKTNFYRCTSFLVLTVTLQFVLYFSCSKKKSDEITLNVYAASSLAAPIQKIVSHFEQHHSNTKINLSLAASSLLAKQIIMQAPADVFIVCPR